MGLQSRPPPPQPPTSSPVPPPRVGDKPASSDLEGLSWWVGRLLLLFAPDGEAGLRDRLLAAPDTLGRLQAEDALLRSRIETAGACTIM
jgi:hypothetical protein